MLIATLRHLAAVCSHVWPIKSHNCSHVAEHFNTCQRNAKNASYAAESRHLFTFFPLYGNQSLKNTCSNYSDWSFLCSFSLSLSRLALDFADCSPSFIGLHWIAPWLLVRRFFNNKNAIHATRIHKSCTVRFLLTGIHDAKLLEMAYDWRRKRIRRRPKIIEKAELFNEIRYKNVFIKFGGEVSNLTSTYLCRHVTHQLQS